MLPWLILWLTLLLLRQQRDGLLAEELQIQSRALDLLLVVLCTEPVLRIEEVVDEARRVLAVPVELGSEIEEPFRAVPDGEAASPAGFLARRRDERLDRGLGDSVVGSFQKTKVGASAPLRRREVFSGQ